MSVYQIIEQLRSDSSRNFKMEVLVANKDNELLKAILKAALEPRVNYYLKKIPKYSTITDRKSRSLDGAASTSMTLPMSLSWLAKLSNRDVTGNAAVKLLTGLLEALPEDDAKVLELIIERDLKCGVNVSTINKVFTDLISETPYMRCSLVRDMKGEPTPEDPWISQVKADGSFVYIIHQLDGEIILMTRNGNVYPLAAFNKLVGEIRKHLPKGFVYHGEFLVRQNDEILPRQVGNGQLNSALQGEPFDPGCEPVIDMWDVIPAHLFTTKDKDTTPYKVRFKFLEGILAAMGENQYLQLIESEWVTSMKEAYDHYQRCLDRKLEGTVLSKPDGIWKDGTSKEKYKLKLEVEVDLRITGFTDGKGKNAGTFGSIICETEDGELIVGVSGFTDKERMKIHEAHTMWNSVVGKIMTVRSNNLISNGSKYSLFLPRHIEIRQDKTEADTIEQVIAQFESAMKGTIHVIES